MIPYVTRTGTRSTQAKLRAAGWRMLVTPQDPRCPDGFRFALDNGAWSAYATGRPWDEGAFTRALDRLGPRADWVVVPDVVADGARSLERSARWLDRCRTAADHVLVPVQDGVDPEDMLADTWDLGPNVGVFVGGSTEWKERTLRDWGELAAFAGCHLHVGRVNTLRRIRICQEAGARSFDGTSVARFPVNLEKLDAGRRQEHFFWD